MSKMSALHFEEQCMEHEEYGTVDGRFVVIEMDTRYTGAAAVFKVLGPFTMTTANKIVTELYATTDKEHKQFLVWPMTKETT